MDGDNMTSCHVMFSCGQSCLTLRRMNQTFIICKECLLVNKDFCKKYENVLLTFLQHITSPPEINNQDKLLAVLSKKCKDLHTSSICARHGLLQCKILHQAHWTKEKLSERCPDIDPAFNHCKMIFKYILELLQAMYWTSVKTVSEVLGVTTDPCPIIVLFRVPSDVYSLNKLQRDFLAYNEMESCNSSISHTLEQKYLVLHEVIKN